MKRSKRLIGASIRRWDGNYWCEDAGWWVDEFNDKNMLKYRKAGYGRSTHKSFNTYTECLNELCVLSMQGIPATMIYRVRVKVSDRFPKGMYMREIDSKAAIN